MAGTTRTFIALDPPELVRSEVAAWAREFGGGVRGLRPVPARNSHITLAFLGELERLPGCCGIKVFMGASTGTLLVQDDEGIEQVLRHINRRAAFHSEDEYRLAERRPLARTGDWTSHPEVRDAQSAIQSTHRLVRLAKEHCTARDPACAECPLRAWLPRKGPLP